MEKQQKEWQILGGSKITADGDCSHEMKRCLLLGRKVMTNLDSILKSTDIYFANKGPSSQSYGFSNNHVWMWELDYKESWVLKNWCFFSIFIYLLIYLLYNVVLVLAHINMNPPQVYTCSPCWTPLLHSSPPYSRKQATSDVLGFEISLAPERGFSDVSI